MKKNSVLTGILLILAAGSMVSCVTAAVAGLEPVPAEPRMVVINEAASTGEYEFVELHNIMNHPIILGEGWVLDDNGEEYQEGARALSLPAGIFIPAGGYLLVCPFTLDKAADVLNNEAIPETALVDIAFGLNQIDSVMLYYNGIVVDMISWETDVNSIGRLPDRPAEFSTLLQPTPGTKNVKEPAARTDYRLVINEIRSRGDDFIELYNTGSTELAFSSGAWTLEDIGKDTVIVIPRDVTVPAGGYLTVFTDGSGTPRSESAASRMVVIPPAEGFGLGSYDTAILRRNGQIVDIRSWSGHADSAGRLPDGSDNWELNLTPSPGKANAQ